MGWTRELLSLARYNGRVHYPRPFGNYLLLERLGAGGMAEVDLARRSEAQGHFHRFVVIKRLTASNAMDEGFVRMFKDEARITAQLHHHNIAQVYDFGVEGEEFFLAMEYVPGMDLREVQHALARQGRMLNTRVSLTVLSHVLEALHYAHHFVDTTGTPLNIVHRDVNPRNVMLSLSGEVKLIDFGVAKAEGRLEKTEGQSFKGKFAYMAPEQVEGQSDIDGRADLFSAGLMLHELLVGVHPFAGLRQAQIVHRLMSGQVARLDEVVHGVDMAALERVHRKSLAVERHQRYRDAGTFQQDILALLEPFGGPCTREELASFLRTADPEMAGGLNARLTLYQTADPRPQALPPPPTMPVAGDDTSYGTLERDGSPPQKGLLLALGGAVVLLTGVIVALVVGIGLQSDEPALVVAPEPEAPVLSLEALGGQDTGVPLSAWIEEAEPSTPRTLPPRKAGKKKAKPTPKATTGLLMVNSVPAGARVYLDGEDVGQTPLRLTVKAGTHEVLLIDEVNGKSKKSSVKVSAGGLETVKAAWSL